MTDIALLLVFALIGIGAALCDWRKATEAARFNRERHNYGRRM
jgi:hypothetical protein